MYHRIADRGPRALARYRLSPATFEEQLAALREWGYHSVTLEDWRRACLNRRPLPGKAVLITFDDGYRDFAEDAWPLLERHGFGATLFVVAGAAGDCSRWDAEHGRPAGLLGWDEIAELARRGVQIGSHTVNHAMLSSLSNADLVRELGRSRMLIEERLGQSVDAIAYPYGDVDAAVAHLAGACGYTLGVTCDPRHAELFDRPLLLPRFEIEGDFTIHDFARTLDTE
jgi:peptidoglycan/xylan/chitin deacetylase (PgdA/CDA1 family)